jgi:hypothetical protein
LVDVRRVQKEINATSESSKRSFSLADEIIYQVAKTKKDPTATEAYRHVVNMREGFVHLVQVTEDIGKAKNDTKEVESRIDQIGILSSHHFTYVISIVAVVLICDVLCCYCCC